MMAIVWTATMFAQPKGSGFRKAYIGAYGLVHVVNGAGKDLPMAKEEGQVSVSSPLVAPDGRTAGWMVEEDNCCTSYPIATSVAIYSGKGRYLLGDGLMIYDWCYVGDGAEVAVSTGTVHGMTYRHLLLYSAGSGRLLKHWDGDFEATAPVWWRGLKE